LIFAMEVTVEFKSKVRGVEPESLSVFAMRACRAAGLRGGIGIVVTSDAEMKKMNAWFRDKAKPTDVLSFTAHGIKGYAGDIAISADIARANSARLRHSLEEELKVLILHGVLHLAGHDHETDNGEMSTKEMKLRERFGLPPALTQRGTSRSRAKGSRAR
jgi:probable rRNA maturation factor